MLGLQETRSAGTPSSKTYSCVACSATFQGLSSLLVHQASHANEISDQKVTTLPVCSHCGSLFATQELLEKHHCMVLPPPVTQDVYICNDCGEEFHEFSAFHDHKKLHEIEPQLKPQLDASSEETLVEKDSCSVTVNVPFDLPSPCPDELLQHKIHISDVVKKECTSTADLPLMHNTISQEHHDEGLQPSDLAVTLTPDETQDQSSKNEVDILKSESSPISDSEELPNKSKELTANNNQSLLKMLASVYTKQSQTCQNQEQSKRTLPPRKVSPRAPVQPPVLSSGYFSNQLTEKFAKPTHSSEGFRQPSNILKKKKKKKKRIVSTTKTLYPVVALETCQKLVRNNTEGKHQCGICRRVFQDVDSLIMHHALHKKERVKFCRRCKEYVIRVISVPTNHICSGLTVATNKFVRKNVTSNRRPTIMHPQKLFRCKRCNRSYTRRHRLNTHNCQLIASPFFGAPKERKFESFVEGCNEEKEPPSVKQNSSNCVDIGVETVKQGLIKTEELDSVSTLEESYQTALMTQPFSHSAKSFPLFLSKISKISSVQSRNNVNSFEHTAAQDDMRKAVDKEASASLESSQWTEPLDDAEVDVMMEVDEQKHGEAPKNSDDVVLEPTIKFQTSFPLSSRDFQVHVSESGVKRFSCNRCHRSYSRCFTVKQHLKICGARKFMEQLSFGRANILALKKKFPCPCCGTSFTRKDNMNLHHKRCQSMRNTNPLDRNKMVVKQNQSSNENMFVLPPVSKSPVRQESSSHSGGGNWGIMSLPSVLPRKVTCECGASFTCPRLLFEHLQLHAMESYICSHCGENLQSWADFETHQQLHVQTSSLKNEQKGSQQQSHVQPLFQQRPQFQTSEQSLKKQPQDLLKSRLNRRPLTEPCVCHRCKKTFGGRKSLLRHLRLSCRGDIAVQKKHSCSRCGITFQSSLSYKVHVQSNTCTPSFKPIRCPVCVRWFSGLEGLKRHLVSHSQQNVLTCQICGHTCSGLESLEEHKIRVHGAKEASESPTIQSAHVSQSNPSNAFRCQICQRSYPKLQSLKDHLRKVHHPKDLNPVGVGAFEPRTGALQLSVGTVQQSQYKQFQCHICSRTYPDIRSLKNHRRRVHRILGSGLQASNTSLQQSHSSPFQCHICSRSYPDLRSLRNHRRRVHRILGGLEMFKGIVHQNQDNNPFRCHICHRTYPDVRSLKNHRRRVHRILGDVPESLNGSTSDDDKSEVLDVPSPSAAFETAAQ